jgi:Flp pilus assembly protein TadG
MPFADSMVHFESQAADQRSGRTNCRKGRTMLSCRRGSNMAEAAVTMPVVLFVLMFGINVSLASYTAMVAADAAGYGARVGAVSRINPKMWAETAAQTSCNQSSVGSLCTKIYAQVDPKPGGAVTVSVTWRYPSYLAGLCSLFGGGCDQDFGGTEVAVWKKEGW